MSFDVTVNPQVLGPTVTELGVNNGTAPVTATITVTRHYLNKGADCTGATNEFHRKGQSDTSGQQRGRSPSLQQRYRVCDQL
jgi:hypothetical protein